MAFNTSGNRVEYTASTGQTIFPYSFKLFSDTDMKVYKTPSGQGANDTNDLLILGSDYTVTIDGDNGGIITLQADTVAGDKITLFRLLPVSRETDYQENGDLLASTLDNDQNYQTYMIADMNGLADRMVQLPMSSQNVSGVLPIPESEQYLRWNSTGTALENDTAASGSLTQAVQAAEDSAQSATQSAASATQSASYAANSSTSANISTTQADLAADSATQSAASATASEQSSINAQATEASINGKLETEQSNGKTIEENVETITSEPTATLIADAETNANNSQLKAWESEAMKKTSDSYATEPEDVVVKIWSSDGDGTFTATNTDPAEYSSLHYAAKAQSVAVGDALLAANNLNDVDDISASRTNLGVDSSAEVDSKISSIIPDDIGLGNVDNTADINKPISSDTQTALDLKADITELSSKAEKAQDSSTETIYTDATTTTEFKLYLDNDKIILEEL